MSTARQPARHVRNLVAVAGDAEPGYTLIRGAERKALDTLDYWLRALFERLVRSSDYESGEGSTSYAALVKHLGRVVQPTRGPRIWVPDLQAVQRGVIALESRGLLTRRKERSQHERKLCYQLKPRRAQVRAIDSAARRSASG